VRARANAGICDAAAAAAAAASMQATPIRTRGFERLALLRSGEISIIATSF